MAIVLVRSRMALRSTAPMVGSIGHVGAHGGAPRVVGVRAPASCRRGGEGLVEILDDVVEVFEPDREPDHVGADAGGVELFVGQLLMGGRRRDG